MPVAFDALRTCVVCRARREVSGSHGVAGTCLGTGAPFQNAMNPKPQINPKLPLPQAVDRDTRTSASSTRRHTCGPAVRLQAVMQQGLARHGVVVPRALRLRVASTAPPPAARHHPTHHRQNNSRMTSMLPRALVASARLGSRGRLGVARRICSSSGDTGSNGTSGSGDTVSNETSGGESGGEGRGEWHGRWAQRASVASGLVDEWHTIRENERPGADERQAASELPRTEGSSRDSNSAATATAPVASVSDAPEAQAGDAVACPNDALTVDGQVKAPHVDGPQRAKAKAPHFDGRDGGKAPHVDGRRQFTVGPANEIDTAIAVAPQVIGCRYLKTQWVNTALDDEQERRPGTFCSPPHRIPYATQETKLTMRVDDAAGGVCSPLVDGHALRVCDRPGRARGACGVGRRCGGVPRAAGRAAGAGAAHQGGEPAVSVGLDRCCSHTIGYPPSGTHHWVPSFNTFRPSFLELDAIL